MRIVLDTNALIQSIPERSPYYAVWESLVRGENTLCVTNEIIEEYTEVLQRLTDEETAEIVISTIINSPFVDFVVPYYHFEMIKTDPDDNKFVDCAIAAQARYIISNDHHFNILKSIPYPHVDVLSLSTFLAILLSTQ